MDNDKVHERMRADWNQRADEDANYYVAFGRREQDDEEFFSTALDIVQGLIWDLKRVRGRDAALEIGCGPGRLMRPLSTYFQEIHGVDVSDEMVRLAQERLHNTLNAHLHRSSGSDLAMFPDEKFDFVYSYAVFQHIPSRDVVFSYLREARRVLKTGGILRCQMNGLPPYAKQYDTWSGVRITPEEITQFAREQDLQLLVVEQIWTQYMWITCRKRPAGWSQAGSRVGSQAGLQTGQQPDRPPCLSRLKNISNALTGEAVAPASGPLAALSLWIEDFPGECDLNNTVVRADGLACRLSYIGEPEHDGVCQVNVALPGGLRTGMVPVDVTWLGQPVCPTGWIRIMPPGPAVPRITTVTDGINLLSGTRIVTGSVKVTMLEVTHPEEWSATVDGHGVLETEWFCADPISQRFEFNFRLTDRIGKGPHEVTVKLGRRQFPPLAIEVA